MTEELDNLLAYIEKDGGFRDACITLQQRPLSVLEGDLQNLLELLQVFKVIEFLFIQILSAACSELLLNMSDFDLQNKLEEQCSKADDLRNKMFQGTSCLHLEIEQ
jgi:nuclear pore complex protein Nup214